MIETPDGEVVIDSESDIVIVRKAVRDATTAMGFSVTDVTRIVTAASELARNIYRYAGSGIMEWRKFDGQGSPCIELSFEDKGPGIPDITQAMVMGYTTGDGLGMGLPGAKRLMDEIEVDSQVGRGTTVTVRKWLKK